MARSEKSIPVALAPRLTQESVSSPKWHWRWSRSLPATSPTSSTISGYRSLRAPDFQPSTS
jgi:hypothetical protein